MCHKGQQGLSQSSYYAMLFYQDKFTKNKKTARALSMKGAETLIVKTFQIFTKSLAGSSKKELLQHSPSDLLKLDTKDKTLIHSCSFHVNERVFVIYSAFYLWSDWIFNTNYSNTCQVRQDFTFIFPVWLTLCTGFSC